MYNHLMLHLGSLTSLHSVCDLSDLASQSVLSGTARQIPISQLNSLCPKVCLIKQILLTFNHPKQKLEAACGHSQSEDDYNMGFHCKYHHKSKCSKISIIVTRFLFVPHDRVHNQGHLPLRGADVLGFEQLACSDHILTLFKQVQS